MRIYIRAIMLYARNSIDTRTKCSLIHGTSHKHIKVGQELSINFVIYSIGIVLNRDNQFRISHFI